MTNSDPLSIWAVSDGRTGLVNQVLGLAEAISRLVPATIVEKRVSIKQPFDMLPHQIWGSPFKRLSPTSDTFPPPFPDIWIGCGRRTVPFSMAMHGKGPFVVQTQDPKAEENKFDLIIPPFHDLLRGENVLPIIGSPNRLTSDKLKSDSQQLEPALPDLPRPLAAVLIGGKSKNYQLSDNALKKMIEEMRLVMASGVGLLITTSRRTGAKATAAIRAALAGPRAWVWDGKPIGGMENPYFGMLGLASRIFVTEESANMMTDAAFTGKPVHLLSLEGGAPKWTRLHESFEQHGITRPDASHKDEWSYTPLNETERAAREILRRMARLAS